VTNQAFFLHTLNSEFDRFHNVVAALPADRLDYRHDPRSRSATELVEHLIGHFEDLNKAVDLLDRGAREAAARLTNVSDEAWAQPGEFFVGDRSIVKAPRHALAWMLLLDAIHHRGQLSTLIRPMGGKVPSIYGPSADTVMGG
jgi:hypothetical protein